MALRSAELFGVREDLAASLKAAGLTRTRISCWLQRLRRRTGRHAPAKLELTRRKSSSWAIAPTWLGIKGVGKAIRTGWSGPAWIPSPSLLSATPIICSRRLSRLQTNISFSAYPQPGTSPIRSAQAKSLERKLFY